jgi:hypothetical protein
VFDEKRPAGRFQLIQCSNDKKEIKEKQTGANPLGPQQRIPHGAFFKDVSAG